jgi:uncharacterized protein
MGSDGLTSGDRGFKSSSSIPPAMAGDIEIHLKSDMDLTGALVIIGAPTLGLVGTITARFLTQSLEMELLGGFHSDRFPPSVIVHDGVPLHPVRIHALKTKCGLDLECEKVVVLTSETFLEPGILWPLGKAIVDWCKKIESNLVIVPDAVRPPGKKESETIRGIASTPRASELLEKMDVQALSDGLIMGNSASLLLSAEHDGLDLMCLLSESVPDHPDARAAARIVKLLDRVMPDIHIESRPLLEEAEKIEGMVRRMRDDLETQKAASRGHQETSMFS